MDMTKFITAGIATLLLSGAVSVAMATEAAAASPTYTCTLTDTFSGGGFTESVSTVTGPGKATFQKQGYNCVKNP
jgi:hypothetical protein